MANIKTSAKEELSALRQWKAPILGEHFFPKEMKTLVSSLGDNDDNQLNGLVKFDLIQIRDEVKNGWSDSHSLNFLQGRSLRMSPYILFASYDKQSPLGYSEDFALAYLKLLQQLSRPRMTIRTVREFLYEYPLECASFDMWLEKLRMLIQGGSSGRLVLWQQRNEQHRLLYKNGPKLCATFLYDAKGTIIDNLSKIGMTNRLISGKYAEALHREYLSRLSKDLRHQALSEARLTKLSDFAFEDDDWRFPDQKHLVAESLLKPFSSSDPSEGTKKLIQSFLLEHLGDPRMKRGAWFGVSEVAKSVLRRWLVGATLKDFFRLIDKTALDRMWRHRHAFWDAYLKKGVITDAWVALGSSARDISGRYLDKETISQYGDLNTREQSVLLLRIGNLTIIEWSHIGKCRIWTKQRDDTPVLYKKRYVGWQLKSNTCDFSISHFSPENYLWQRKLAEYIHSRTRIRMYQEEYKVRRR